MTTQTNPPSTDSDRRNVPAREHPLSKAAARLLARANITPDTISVFGVLAALAGGLCLIFTAEAEGLSRRLLWIAAGSLAGLRLICNMLDGMVAVEWGKGSPLGPLYNEIPDRIADFAILAGAGYAYGGHAALGYWAASLAVFTAYIRVAVRSVGGPSDFGGPMAKPQRMAVIIATCAYLGFTPESWHPAFGDMREYGLITAALILVAAGSGGTCLFRLRRGARFMQNAANN